MTDLENETKARICDWNNPSHLTTDMKGTCKKIAAWHTIKQLELISWMEEQALEILTHQPLTYERFMQALAKKRKELEAAK